MEHLDDSVCAADADSIMLIGQQFVAAAPRPGLPRRPMFENPPRSRKTLLPRGVVVSLLVHAGTVLFLIRATSGANVPIARNIDVMFLKYRMAPPPPRLPPFAAKQKSRPIAKPVQPRPTIRRVIVAPKALPQEKPPEVPPDERRQETGEEGGTDEGEPGGVASGVSGGVAGGVVGGIVGSPPQS